MDNKNIDLIKMLEEIRRVKDIVVEEVKSFYQKTKKRVSETLDSSDKKDD